MKSLKLSNILLAACCLVTTSAFAGCNDNDDKDGKAEILKPIARHLAGKWNCTASYIEKDGKWVNDPIPEGEGMTYTFRTDGTMVAQLTPGDGFTKFAKTRWETDDDACTLKMLSLTSDESTTSLIHVLTDKLFVLSGDWATDSETGDQLTGEFKWEYTRVDETVKTPAEKIIGKWEYKYTYRKDENGEWKQYDNPYVPDKAWIEYHEDGTGTYYLKMGESEYKNSGKWDMNNTTVEIRTLSKDDGTVKSVTRITFEGDDAYSFTYTENLDVTTGEVMETGEFKDVWVRVQQ